MITEILYILIAIVISIAVMIVLFAITARIVIGTRGGLFEPLVRLTILPAFIILDWLYNWTIASIVFMELPHRLGELVTERMKRYKVLYSDSNGTYWYEQWRYSLSVFICKQLSVHDRGHC